MISREEYATLVSAEGKNEGDGKGGEEGEETDGTEGGARQAEADVEKGVVKEKEKENLASIGASRKRKAVKIVAGAGSDDEEADAKTNTDAESKPKAKPSAGDTKKGSGGAMPKQAKKGKKIKLSFGDDEG